MALRICRALPAIPYNGFRMTFDPIVPDPKRKMAEVQQAGERLPRIHLYTSILHALKCNKVPRFVRREPFYWECERFDCFRADS